MILPSMILVLVAGFSAQAALVPFQWSASPFSPNEPISYRLYAYPDGAGTNLVSDAGSSLSVSVPFGPGIWNLYIVAVNTNGIESDRSNVIRFSVPWPPTIRLASTIEKAQSPKGPWLPLMGEEAEVVPDGTNQFFRVKVNIAQP